MYAVSLHRFGTVAYCLIHEFCISVKFREEIPLPSVDVEVKRLPSCKFYEVGGRGYKMSFLLSYKHIASGAILVGYPTWKGHYVS